MNLPPELDPRQVAFDPEASAKASQLEAALVVAATTSSDLPDKVGPIPPERKDEITRKAVALLESAKAAFTVAKEMAARKLVSGTPGQTVASALIQLTIQHLQASPEEPDPYALLCRRWVQAGVLQQEDVTTARQGLYLHIGLNQGWLPAEMYDELKRIHSSAMAIMLAGIEPRTSTR